MQAKKNLALRLVSRFHSESEAQRALQDFDIRFSKRDLAHANLPTYTPSTTDLVSLVVDAYTDCFDMKKSRGEVRRLIEQGSVQWEGNKITDITAQIEPKGILRLDKIRAVRLGLKAKRV